jgi:glycosyltransferase involved in cell wall biosynthesis
MRLGINATILDARPSGLGVYTAHVIQELDKRVRDLTVYATGDAIPGLRPEALRLVSPRVRPSRGARGHAARFLWTHTVLPRRLRRDGRSVVLTTCPEPLLISPVPQACVVHDLIALRFPEHFPRLRWYFARMLPLLAKRCAAVIVDSEATRRDVVTWLGVSADVVHVVWPGHDRERFHPAVAAEPARARYRLDRYLLYVGNVLPHKNPLGLVRAFAGIAPRCPHQLVIVGHRDPRYVGALDAEIAAQGLAGRVVFLDYAPAADLPALYAGAELYVHPALWEGFGLTVLEAMACGTPVVSTRGGSLPEVGGDAVLWADPGDVEGLARAMEQALADRELRSALRARGLARAAGFSWEATGQKLWDVLRGIGAARP